MDAEREVLDVLARNAREDIDDIAAPDGPRRGSGSGSDRRAGGG